jgi:hypothetical protein
MGSTASPAGCIWIRVSRRAASARPTTRRALGAAAHLRGHRPRGRGRRALHHLAGNRGLQLPVPDTVCVVVAAAHRRDRPIRTSRERARRHHLPRAQELRARDEDPHAEHRHDASRDPHAAHAGHRQRQGQHGLAASGHERREPRRVRGTPRSRGAAQAPARELRLGNVRRRQHGRRNRVHGDTRAGDRAAPRRLRRQRRAARLRPLSVTEDAVGAVKRSVLQWGFIDGIAAKLDGDALREAQQHKDAVRAYEIVYAALGEAPPPL